ncbi:PAAR-like domain-containing protein [Caballeronia sp. ATUFL_M2_KS44]|uniref:PAAR-like domain-containing protein n=1 Tax=Caballeronia sp. ATUFL_M2_KS44 TaxID=2921767 RepID=UPI0020282B63|nr:PAAR-like domain-containing protein [Caballeronia sp. ATUFL_M2_KS44]
MANKVYANKREVACKQGSGKSICTFPDTCFTPPQTPATPTGTPVPYANSSVDEDTADGTTSVQISGQEVMLKDKSSLKKSVGNEAGCAPQKGLVSTTNKGETLFCSGSMNITVEGENLCRHLDTTTHNQCSKAVQTLTWPFLSSQAMPSGKDPCETERAKVKSECAGLPSEESCKSSSCSHARCCVLVPYGGPGSPNCPCNNVSGVPTETGHHMIEQHWIRRNSRHFPKYNGDDAPTVCVEGTRFTGQHGLFHAVQGAYEDSFLPPGPLRKSGTRRPAGINHGKKDWNYGEGKRAALMAHKAVFGLDTCSEECLIAQMDSFYGSDNARPLKRSRTNKRQSIRDRPDATAFVDIFFQN